MSFCLYNSNEVFNILNQEIEMSVLDKWAETHKLFFNKIFIWEPKDIDMFLYEHFDSQKILKIKTENKIPLNEKEKLLIILDQDKILNDFQKYIPYDELIEIKKKNNIPITNLEFKNKIDTIKENLYNNIEYENTLNLQKANANTIKNTTAVHIYRNVINDEINAFEDIHTDQMFKTSSQKHRVSKWLIVLFVISVISALITSLLALI